jgi:hypothetical protein
MSIDWKPKYRGIFNEKSFCFSIDLDGQEIELEFNGQNNGSGVFEHFAWIKPKDLAIILRRLNIIKEDVISEMLIDIEFLDLLNQCRFLMDNINHQCDNLPLGKFDLNQDENMEERILEATKMLEKCNLFKDESEDIKNAYDYIFQQIELGKEYLENSRTAKGKRKEFSKIRNKVFMEVGNRDGFLCNKCGETESLTVDHILALSKGGDNCLENYQLLCKSCNSKKHTKDNSLW